MFDLKSQNEYICMEWNQSLNQISLKQEDKKYSETVSVEVQTVRDPFYLTRAPEHDNFKPESHMKYC